MNRRDFINKTTLATVAGFTGGMTLSAKADALEEGLSSELDKLVPIDIDAMRLMVLRAARAMDVLGNQEARIMVHAVKAMVPERVCQIIDQAIQMHGATGVSQWTPLADMYTSSRTLRIADGPDEVHHLVVGRHEMRKYMNGA